MSTYMLQQLKWMNGYRRHLHLRGEKGKETGAGIWINRGFALSYSLRVTR